MKFGGKYRGNSKIKHKHRIIIGLRKFLEKIQNIDEIDAINPGIISRIKSANGDLIFKCQYVTNSGLKYIAKNKGTAQEVFIVSSKPEIVKEKLNL